MEAREENVHKEKPKPKPRTRKNINSITKQDNTTTNFQYENTRNKEENTYEKEDNAVKFREGESSEDCNADDEGQYSYLLFQSKHIKENDETNNASSDEEEEHNNSEEKEIKNVRPPPRRNIKDKILFHSPWRAKYGDKIEEIEAEATATLEIFKNNPLTKASYQSYKKLLIQTRGELKVIKPKNKKQRNKLENAIQFTESVMKDVDDEFKKLYVTSQISSKNK